MAYSPPDFERKLCAPSDVVQRVAELPRPLIFTNGCFDLLHRGHVTYLAQARALGKSLLVAVNSDASVRRLGKGGDRPINSQNDRMAVLAALASVDLITWFDAESPLDLILACKPDVLVKGGDWPAAEIIGAGEVLGWGGQVHSIPFLFTSSTTAIIARIRTAG